MSGTLNFVLLHVHDIAAARDFYTGEMGFALEGESPSFVQFLASDGAIFALQLDDQATPSATVELWWQVEDADAIYAALSEHHVEIIGAPEDRPFGRAFSLKDPGGNVVNLYQPRQA